VDAGWLRVRDTGVEVRVRVVPGARSEGIAGFYGDRLRVRVRDAATDGKANEALLALLARTARVATAQARIVTGRRDRSKTVLLVCPDPVAAAERLRRAATAAVDKTRSHT
jgi:hypothetical protein